MSNILGLVSGKTFTDNTFLSLNDRRMVFHEYPNGAATLTGLLSLMETEATDNMDFGWFEKRWRSATTILATHTTGPILTGGTDTAITSPVTTAVDDSVRIKVADSSDFRVTQVIWIMNLPVTNTTFQQLKGVITSIPTSTTIEFRALNVATAVLNTTNLVTGGTAGPVGATVQVIGTANEEGGTATGNSRMIIPCNPSNYTQIFKTPYSFTLSSIQQPAVFDKTGLYRERAKDACVEHMTEIEKALLFGVKNITTKTSSDNEQVPERTLGGLTYFLEQYEVAASIYRGSTSSAATADTDDNKRIIMNASGTMTRAVFEGYIERCFRVTNNKSFEKLVLCGSGVMTTLNNLVRAQVITNKNMGAESTYGMNVITIETPHGILHFKSHPLFTQDTYLRYSMFIIDVQNLRLRPLNKRDTQMLSNLQLPGQDRRRDMWLSELGFECRFPESHMVIHNFQEVTLT